MDGARRSLELCSHSVPSVNGRGLDWNLAAVRIRRITGLFPAPGFVNISFRDLERRNFRSAYQRELTCPFPRGHVLLSKKSNVCSSRILLDEPREGYAASSRLLDLDKCSWRELERSYGEFFLRLARAEDLAWDSDNLPALEVFRDLAEVQDYSCSAGFAQEAGYRDPERSLVLFSRLHEVAYGADQFRVCWPTLLHFLDLLGGATRYRDAYQ